MRDVWMTLLLAMCAGGLMLGCDDAGGDTAADMGGGGEGGGGEIAVETFVFTALNMTEPAGAAGLLNPVLTSNLNNGSLVVLVQIEGWSTETPILRGGAGQLTAGADTEDDVSDDVFAWLTEGTCEGADGNETPCSVDISESTAARSGDDFTLTDGEIAIYAQDLKLIIPIKGLNLTGSRDGIDLTADLAGVITQMDAQNTRFRLTPNGDQLTLEQLLTMVSVEPDTEFEGQPAYTFEGTFRSELVAFADE